MINLTDKHGGIRVKWGRTDLANLFLGTSSSAIASDHVRLKGHLHQVSAAVRSCVISGLPFGDVWHSRSRKRSEKGNVCRRQGYCAWNFTRGAVALRLG